MGLTAHSGPLVVHGPAASYLTKGQNPVIPQNPDAAPSVVFGGVALMDPRYSYKSGGGTESNALLACGLGPNGQYTVLDQVPSTAAVANIAVGANAVNGTPQVLVNASGAGVTVLTAPLTIPQTGQIVPAGALALDSAPALLLFGTNKSIGVADPTKNLSRAVSITGVVGGAGGNVLVSGMDLYGFPQTEVIAAAAGAATTNGRKAFKFVTSVTPQFTDAHAYSVGTADVFGFPMRVDRFPYAVVGWNNAIIGSATGFVAAVTTAATNTTGDVRGTYAVQSASDGTKALQMFITPSPANVSTVAGLFGVTPA